MLLKLMPHSAAPVRLSANMAVLSWLWAYTAPLLPPLTVSVLGVLVVPMPTWPSVLIVILGLPPFTKKWSGSFDSVPSQPPTAPDESVPANEPTLIDRTPRRMFLGVE